MSNRFYVTKFGIAASLVNARTHQDIKLAIDGRLPVLAAQRLIRDGFIAEDMRAAESQSINFLAVNGALDQIRGVLESLQPGGIALRGGPRQSDDTSIARSLPTPQPSNKHWGRTPVGYTALPPKSRMPKLSPAAQAVYAMLRDTPQSTAELARKLRNLNPTTVKWAIQFLRQKGLAQSQPLAA